MNYQKGFTLIELLIVAAIISMLATVVLVSLGRARESARQATALQQLREIEKGMMFMAIDTGKAPNGCTPGVVANPEVQLHTNQAGLTQQPNTQNNGTGCEWDQNSVDAWDGPYITADAIDPWGRGYQFDPDYAINHNCPTEPNQSSVQAIVSLGPDGIYYTCDDLYVEIR